MMIEFSGSRHRKDLKSSGSMREVRLSRPLLGRWRWIGTRQKKKWYSYRQGPRQRTHSSLGRVRPFYSVLKGSQRIPEGSFMATPILFALLTFQVTWYVDQANCPGPGDGSQSNPFCHIQDGLDAASPGDTVLVLPVPMWEISRLPERRSISKAPKAPVSPQSKALEPIEWWRSRAAVRWHLGWIHRDRWRVGRGTRGLRVRPRDRQEQRDRAQRLHRTRRERKFARRGQHHPRKWQL